MRITEKQLILLMDTLRGSLNIADGGAVSFGYGQKVRIDLYDAIINQQSEVMIEVGPKIEEPKEME